jgi:hypothetical protein
LDSAESLFGANLKTFSTVSTHEAYLKAQADAQAAKPTQPSRRVPSRFFALECTGGSGWLFRWWSAPQSLSVGL